MQGPCPLDRPGRPGTGSAGDGARCDAYRAGRPRVRPSVGPRISVKRGFGYGFSMAVDRLGRLSRIGGAGVVAAGLILGAAGPAQAFNSSAWTRPQNQLYTLLSYGSILAGEQFGIGGRTSVFVQGRDEDTLFVDESFYSLIEFGATDWLTLHLELPYKRVLVRIPNFDVSTRAFGNLYAGLRLGIFELLEVDVPVVWSIELGGFFPTGYTRNFAPSVGAGNIDFDLKTAVGYGFSIAGVLPSYTQLGFGFRARSTAFALSSAIEACNPFDNNCVQDVRPVYGDEFMFLGEWGLTPFDGALLAFAKVMGNVSLQAPEVGFTAANPIPTRQRYLKVGGGGMVYPLRFFDVPYAENVGLMAQYYSTVWGENVPKTDDLFFGIEYTHNF